MEQMGGCVHSHFGALSGHLAHAEVVSRRGSSLRLDVSHVTVV
jgi:hypothetical protein